MISHLIRCNVVNMSKDFRDSRVIKKKKKKINCQLSDKHDRLYRNFVSAYLFLPEWTEKHSKCPNFLNVSLFENKWKFQGLNILEFW